MKTRPGVAEIAESYPVIGNGQAPGHRRSSRSFTESLAVPYSVTRHNIAQAHRTTLDATAVHLPDFVLPGYAVPAMNARFQEVRPVGKIKVVGAVSWAWYVSGFYGIWHKPGFR